MDWSLPASSIHGSFQARVMKWVAIAFSEAGYFTFLNLNFWIMLPPSRNWWQDKLMAESFLILWWGKQDLLYKMWWIWKNVMESELNKIKVKSYLGLFCNIRFTTASIWQLFLYNLNLFILIGGYFTILYWFCHTSTWIRHGCTHVPHLEPPSHLLPRTIPLGHPSAPAPSILYTASNLDWRFISYMILYMFQCHSPKSSHPLPLPQSPKDCSIHLCLFCCLAYRVMITIFLNSIYMC